ncbi:MAG: hypothetical protein R2779_12535 [Crocinitomicaceae bacterium]|nr:hypothetical protein [Taishania sp.]
MLAIILIALNNNASQYFLNYEDFPHVEAGFNIQNGTDNKNNVVYTDNDENQLTLAQEFFKEKEGEAESDLFSHLFLNDFTLPSTAVLNDFTSKKLIIANYFQEAKGQVPLWIKNCQLLI